MEMLVLFILPVFSLEWIHHKLPLSGELVLTDIHAVISSQSVITAYATGEAGVLLKLRDPDPSSPPPPWSIALDTSFPLYWYGVYSFDENHTLLSGFLDGSGKAYGIVQETFDGGETWTNDTIIDKSQWGGGPIQFADELHGLMPSTSGSVMWRTTNGGHLAKDWEEVTPSEGNWHSGDFIFEKNWACCHSGVNALQLL